MRTEPDACLHGDKLHHLSYTGNVRHRPMARGSRICLTDMGNHQRPHLHPDHGSHHLLLHKEKALLEKLDKRQSLQKNRLIFLQGLLFWARNGVIYMFSEILAQKSAISSARIAQHESGMQIFLFLKVISLF
jgi:hypothetical protein